MPRDGHSTDPDRPAKVVRALGAAVCAIICFAFRADVQNLGLRALLGTIAVLALMWGILPFLKRRG